MGDHSDIDHTGLTGVGGDTAYHGARVWRNANKSINNNTDTLMDFNAETYDTDAYHDNSSNNSMLTVPSGLAGKYHIYGSVEWEAQATGFRQAYIILNNTTILVLDQIAASPSGETRQNFSTTYALSVGDDIEMRVNQTSGGALNAQSSSPFAPILGMDFLG